MEPFCFEVFNDKIADKRGTLMLSTSDPGGGSCRAMVSDVSMVKYRSMGHSFFSGGDTRKDSLKASKDSLNA